MAPGIARFNPIFKEGVAATPRLADFTWGTPLEGRPGISTPKTAINVRELYRLVERCSSLDKAIMTIRDYSWKDGTEWVPKFSLRCKACNYAHPKLARPVVCGKCNGQDTGFLPPNEEEREKADAFLRRMDEHGNTLDDVGRMFSWHMNIADDGFLITPSDYTLDKDGNVIDWEPVRKVAVADPRNFRRVNDQVTGTPAGRWWLCLRHRPGRHFDPAAAVWKKNEYSVYERDGTCDATANFQKCGMRLYEVAYVSLDPTYSETEPAEYYIRDFEMPDGTVLGEVINCQKFHASYDGGRSPIVAVWHIGNALCDMEKFMGTFYKENRNPRKIGFVPTANFKGFESSYREMQNRVVSSGGHGMYWMPYDPGISGGARNVQLIDLDPLPSELQYLQVREEFHRRIAMTYDITPPFHGGMEAVGGQAQMDPLQWQITVLGVQREQKIFNNKLFPRLLQWLKVREWALILREPEEDEMMKRFQVKLLESQEALLKMQLGFMPLGIDSSGHYIFPSTPQMGTSGMGGAQPGGAAGTTPPPPQDQAAEEQRAAAGGEGRLM